MFQGDAGVNAFGTTHYKHFGSRVGFAYSPDWGWLTGRVGKTSIRAGFGIYFNKFNGETAGQTIGAPPYALNDHGVGDLGASPSFANPFAGYMPVTNASGNVVGATPASTTNRFPYAPGPSPDFSIYLPLSISVYDPKINVPYSENFNFTIERQLSASTILSLGYVGAMGHHELLAYELNPSLNAAGSAANPSCTQGSQSINFPTNFRYPGNVFSSIGDVDTVGNSNYHSFQASLNRHFTNGLQFFIAYTWSHGSDDGSGFENSGFGGSGFGGFGNLRGINPFNRHLDYGPSSFDAQHRLVINYVYAIPSVRHFNAFGRWPSRLTDGWQLSGITTFQTGFPLDVFDSSLNSLVCPSFWYYQCPDVPNVVGPITYKDPRTNPTNLWFDPSAFASESRGVIGDAGRNLLRGPHISNFDLAVEKETRITESTRVELRFEFFNIFNHTQFDPAGIVTDINAGPAFGTITAAHDPRLIQLGAKFYF